MPHPHPYGAPYIAAAAARLAVAQLKQLAAETAAARALRAGTEKRT